MAYLIIFISSYVSVDSFAILERCAMLDSFNYVFRILPTRRFEELCMYLFIQLTQI